MKKVTIVVPTLNEQHKVSKCIASILAAGDRVGEIIVVDCNSSDNTCKTVRELARRTPIIELLHADERSYAAAVSHGIKNAAFDYVQLVDGDSLLGAEWLDAGTQHLEAHGYDAVRGVMELRNDSMYGSVRKQGKQLEVSYGGPVLGRTEALKECNYDPELKRSSDLDVYIKLRIAGYKQGFLQHLMLIKNDEDNASLNFRKAFQQGYYSGLMLAKNSDSASYIGCFAMVRPTYALYALYLAAACVGWLRLPRRFMLPYVASPLVARFAVRRERPLQATLWYLDRMARSTAFAMGVSRRPSVLVRLLFEFARR